MKYKNKFYQSEYQKDMQQWLVQYPWHFYTTTTYKYVAPVNYIESVFNDFYNTNQHFILGLVWTLEYTKEGLPHVHGMFYTKNKERTYPTLKRMLDKQGNTLILEYDPNDRREVFSYMYKDFYRYEIDGILGLK